MSTVLERKRLSAANARAARKAKRAAARASVSNGSGKPPEKRVGAGEFLDPIDPALAYSYAAITAKFGIGRRTLRKYELAGMPVGGAGNRKFVRGSALIEAIERASKTQDKPN